MAALAALARFLEWNEARPGAALPDPVLALLAPRDLTWVTFSLIYLGIALGFARLLTKPRALVVALQAYVLMILLRIVAMWATPLEAPPGMLALHDPLVRLFGPARLLSKDLFFSGHTSTLVLLGLTVPGRACECCVPRRSRRRGRSASSCSTSTTRSTSSRLRSSRTRA